MKQYIVFFLVVLFGSCQGTKIDRLLRPASPYEKYVQDLTSSTLKNSGMVREWISEGERVLIQTNGVDLPYRELSRFDRAVPKAASFRFSVREGQRITVSLTALSDTSATYFLDLFEIQRNGEMKSVNPELDDGVLTYAVGSDLDYLLRVQPELLKGGVIDLSISYTGSLAFPVPNKSFLDIGSFFGAARDGGRRTHEGVDVFAARGTPVVAVTNGRVTRVGTNRLGGKTVSVSSGRYSFYYAHLDSQLVTMGRSVRMGDTLGTVGNTGNAITTAPHLHFGIYAIGRKSVDPLPFFREAASLPNVVAADSIRLDRWGRVKGSVINLRRSPTTQSDVLLQLSRHDVFRIDGKSGDWLRVRLPDQTLGYLSERLVEVVDKSLGSKAITEEDLLKADWELPEFRHPGFSGEAELWGSFGGYDLISTSPGVELWVRRSEI